MLGRKEEREIFNVTEQLSPVQAAVQGVVGEVRATREVVARLQQEQAALSRQTEELRNNGLTAKQVCTRMFASAPSLRDALNYLASFHITGA